MNTKELPGYDITFSIDGDSGLYHAVVAMDDGWNTEVIGPPSQGWLVLHDRVQDQIRDHYNSLGFA